MCVDQVSVNISDVFRKQAVATEFTLHFSGFESKNSHAAGEIYHGPLRGIFSVLQEKQRTLHLGASLELSIKVWKDTVGPRALALALLVFLVLPTLSLLGTSAPTLQNPKGSGN